MIDIDDLTKSFGTAVLVIPDPPALIQDLGPMRTGYLMDTDIVPRSAVVAMIDEKGAMEQHSGMVKVAFEGGIYDETTANCFHEKMCMAARRLVYQYPSIAYGHMHPDELQIVARIDLDRMVLSDIYDMNAISDWAEEDPDRIFPPRIPSGSADEEAFKRLLDIGGDTLHCPPMVFQFRNGQVYVQAERYVHGNVYDHDDPALKAFLDAHKIDGYPRRRALGLPEISGQT